MLLQIDNAPLKKKIDTGVEILQLSRFLKRFQLLHEMKQHTLVKPQCTSVVKKCVLIETHLREKIHSKKQERIHSFAMQGWRQECYDGGLTLPTRGLKYGFQGTMNAKNLRKIAFHLPAGGCMSRRGGYSPLALPWCHPCCNENFASSTRWI